jgi:hypothetical protein
VLSACKPGTDDRYWLLVHNAMQKTLTGMDISMFCRLCCEDCFEEMVYGLHLKCDMNDGTQDIIPLLEIGSNECSQ